MIAHHPDDELLLWLAAGRLLPGQALVVAAHVERCAQCGARLRTLHAVGGALLERAEPHPLAPGSLASALQRIADVSPKLAPAPAIPARPPAGLTLPADTVWPRGLGGCKVTPWRWIGPGRRISRVHLPQDPGATVFLLSIAPGRSVPRHGHTQREFTEVLCGAFADERAVFGAGDFDVAGRKVNHAPTAQPGSACVCLTWVEARLRFDGRIAAAIAHRMGV